MLHRGYSAVLLICTINRRQTHSQQCRTPIPASHAGLLEASTSAGGRRVPHGDVVSCYAQYSQSLRTGPQATVPELTSQSAPVCVGDLATFLAQDLPRRPLALWSTVRRLAWSSLSLLACTAAEATVSAASPVAYVVLGS